MTAPNLPKVPVEPLLAIARRNARPVTHNDRGDTRFGNANSAEGDTALLSRYLNISKERVRRYRAVGEINIHVADDLAHELNLHPAMIWPEWHAIPTLDEEEIP